MITTSRRYTYTDLEEYVAGHYGKPVLLRDGDRMRSPLLPDVSMPVADIFRDVVTE
jgi:hypothetical protein